MANACKDCSGMGFGSVNPKFGFDDSTGPCPTCEARLEDRRSAGEQVGELGKPVPVAEEMRETVAFLDGPSRDPDAAGLTAAEAVEAGIFTQDEVDVQAEVDAQAEAAEAGAHAEVGEA